MITVYSLPSCGQCKVLKMKLESKGISFEEIQDIEVLEEKGIMAVPVLDIDGEQYTGVAAMKLVNEMEAKV